MTLDLDTITLSSGSHASRTDGVCVMEAAAWLAGEPHSDHPECVCPVIANFLRRWNDDLPSDDDRDRLLKPLLPIILGTAGTPEVETRRHSLVVDWYVRVYVPAWLDLAPECRAAAADLRALPEITLNNLKLKQTTEALNAAGSAAASAAASAAVDAAGSAAGSAARRAARIAARSAAGSAAGSAAWSAADSAAWNAAASAAWDAARSAAWNAAESAAESAAWIAAWSAADGAARSAARGALAPTVATLQASAQELIRRMCEVQP